MTALLGVMTLANPRSADPALFKAAGCDVLRFPLRVDDDVTDWLDDCARAGITPLAVYDGPARALQPWDWMERYPNLSMVETANEWSTYSPASTTLSTIDVANDTRAWLEAAPYATVILGAVINGPPWLQQNVLDWLKPKERKLLGIGLHLYDTWPDTMLGPGVPGNSMSAAVDAFAAAFGPRLYITETGVDDKGGWQTEYCRETMTYLRDHPAIKLAVWYNCQDYYSYDE